MDGYLLRRQTEKRFNYLKEKQLDASNFELMKLAIELVKLENQ